jgi:hypothetical protein
MTSKQILELVNMKYLERKAKIFDLRYKAPQQLKEIKVSSDQVLALIDVIAYLLENVVKVKKEEDR